MHSLRLVAPYDCFAGEQYQVKAQGTLAGEEHRFLRCGFLGAPHVLTAVVDHTRVEQERLSQLSAHQQTIADLKLKVCALR